MDKMTRLFMLLVTTLCYVHGDPTVTINSDGISGNKITAIEDGSDLDLRTLGTYLRSSGGDTEDDGQDIIILSRTAVSFVYSKLADSTEGVKIVRFEQLFTNLIELTEETERLKKKLNESVTDLLAKHYYLDKKISASVTASSCGGLLDGGFTDDGIYPLNIGPAPARATCDNTNGGWTVIQQRFDDTVSFRQDFQTYQNGFGDPASGFWFGLEKIHQLTKEGTWELRVELSWYDDKIVYQEYEEFRLGPGPYYRIHVGHSTGTAGDSLSSANGMAFSTYDRDQDRNPRRNCASDGQNNGAWWWEFCGDANLNGYTYLTGAYQKGTYWETYLGFYKSMKTTLMKIRKI